MAQTTWRKRISRHWPSQNGTYGTRPVDDWSGDRGSLKHADEGHHRTQASGVSRPSMVGHRGGATLGRLLPEQQGLFFDSLCAAFTPDELRECAAAAGLATARVVVDSDRHVSIQIAAG